MKEPSNQQTLFFNVLLDFLKELPQDFDINNITYRQAAEMIVNFMKKHGLLDDE